MTIAPAQPARLTAGDPLPRLALPDPAGRRFDLQHQSVAGDTLVLWLTAAPLAPERHGVLAAAADDLAAVEARGFVIAPASRPGGAGGTPPVLLDAERRFAATMGIAGDATVLVDPRGRIAAVLPGIVVADALARCRSIHASGTPVVRRAGAPVLIVPEVAEAELRARLIAYWDQGEKLVDMVARNAGAQGEQAATKKRSDVVVKDKDLFETLKARLLARVLPELKRAFGFEAASFEALRVGCYDAAAGGYFKRHRDNSTRFTAHRSFAMSLNLNTGDYEGGQVRFPEFGRDLYEPEAGGAVVFSCNLVHEALPVTTGRRHAVFTFFADAAGAARERQLIAEQAAAGRGGVAVG